MAESSFWTKVHAVAAKATWAYLATADGNQPKVRVVHPAFEGERLWVATGATLLPNRRRDDSSDRDRQGGLC